MTSISSSTSTSSGAATYAAILAAAQKTARAVSTIVGSNSDSQSSATTVTLSDAAKAALAGKDFATVIADARATMDQLLTGAGVQSPLKDGALAVDLSRVDRRELYAMSTNSGQKFTADEQKAATIELQNRFESALAGPTAVGRVTGSIKGLYVAALAYFDQLGPEEKASSTYADQRAAMESMLTQLNAKPSTLPVVDNDPVAAYMQRLGAGETGALRDFGDVTTDARATLDAQYAEGSSTANYTDFDSRSLAAVALNSGGKFTAAEVRTAASEMKTRSGAALLSSLKNANTTDPTAFASNVISLYGAMSPEEREAAGWSEKLYQSAVASYQTASKLADMIGSAAGSSAWGSSTSGDDSQSGSMSIFDYL